MSRIWIPSFQTVMTWILVGTPLIITNLSIAAVWLTIITFESLQDMTRGQKARFNGVTTSLYLLVSISVTKGFRETAKAFAKRSRSARWHKNLSAEEQTLLTNVDEWSTVIHIALKAIRSLRIWASLGCVFWFICGTIAFLGLLSLLRSHYDKASQLLIATISPLIGIQDGSDYNHTIIRPNSEILIPDLQKYNFDIRKWAYADPFLSPSEKIITLRTQQALAHRYGDAGHDALTHQLGCGNYTKFQPPTGKIPFRYYCRNDSEEFAHRFLEFNPRDTLDAYPSVTNRIITATSGPCSWHAQVKRELPVYPRTENNTDQIAEGWNYTYSPGFNWDSTDWIVIPSAAEDWEGTTYIYRGSSTPEEEETWSCGSRCIWMWAHLNPSPKFKGQRGFFARCPIRISTVENATRPEHQLPDGMARLMAASIALHGRLSSDWKDWYSYDFKNFQQYQFYPLGTTWYVPSDQSYSQEVGKKMAEFAIASLSTLAMQNKRITVYGDQPNLASYLDFDKRKIVPPLFSVSAIHLLLFCLEVLLDPPHKRRRKDDPKPPEESAEK